MGRYPYKNKSTWVRPVRRDIRYPLTKNPSHTSIRYTTYERDFHFMDREKIAFIIGRFQVNQLTDAHCQLIDEARKNHETVVVMVGTRETPATNKNPLSFLARKTIINAEFPDVSVVPIADCPTNEEWSANVDKLISAITFPRGAVIYHGRDSFAPHYKGKFELREVNLPEHVDVSASFERDKIRAEGDFNKSPDFYKGIIYAMQTLTPRIYMTVDIAIFDKYSNLLVGKKKGMTKCILPGGFIDVNENPEDAASRELFEETGIQTNKLELVGAYKVNDWRTRGETKVSNMTLLYKGLYNEQPISANDDLDTLNWIELGELQRNYLSLIHPVHHKLIEELLK